MTNVMTTHRAVRFALALGAAAGIGMAHPEPASLDPEREVAPLILRPETARLGSLGFEALVSDYYWLRAVQIVGGNARFSQHAPTIVKLIDAATTVDPWVDHPYRFASLALTDSFESVLEANRLMRRGIAYHPRDWRNRFYLSFNHFFYLGDDATAARELAPAVELPGSPPYLGRLLARLRSQQGSLEVAAAYLQELLRSTDDGYRRAEYEKALEEIETERRARFLDEAREGFRRHNGRDITGVEELVRGPNAPLNSLPPEPHGWEWVLDRESGAIVSSYYGWRYQLHLGERDRKRREAWSQRLREEEGDGS